MEGLGVNLNLILQQVVVFVIFVYLFNRFLLKKLVEIINKREEKIQQGLEFADKMQNEYSSLEEKTNIEIEKARKEASKLIEETKQAAEKIAIDIKNDASKQATSIIEESKKQLEKDREELRSNMNKEIAEILEESLTKIGLSASDEEKKKSIGDAIKEI